MTVDSSIVNTAAASLSPRAVLNAEWRTHLDRLTELQVLLHDVRASHDRAGLEARATQARRQMKDIEAALDRLAHQTYGCCEVCGQRIDALRLVGLPAARDCRRCERRHVPTSA
jgi:RNA polymerase-binding transcription factor DksA